MLRQCIHQFLWGTPFKQEYLCTPLESHQPVLEVWANNEFNITRNHLFLGYRPLLIGFPKSDFGDNLSLTWQQTNTDQAVAKVDLQRLNDGALEHEGLTVYEGKSGWQKFLPPVIQWRHNWRHILRSKKDSAYIDPSIYSQVKAAYAVPRKISVISVGTASQGNVFPTDLHGPLPGDHYAISLREAGKAHQQVMEQEEILLADVEATEAANVYALGKNHMQPLRDLSQEKSIVLDRDKRELLPKGVKCYLKLKRIKGQSISIHHIHLFKITEKVAINDKEETLAHIHRDYATWRWNQGLETKYIQR